MTKFISAAIFLITVVAAYGQNDQGFVAPDASKPTPGSLLNRNNLTSTGATVADPGASQAAGPTPLDRAIRQQDNRIDNSICNGC